MEQGAVRGEEDKVRSRYGRTHPARAFVFFVFFSGSLRRSARAETAVKAKAVQVVTRYKQSPPPSAALHCLSELLASGRRSPGLLSSNCLKAAGPALEIAYSI